MYESTTFWETAPTSTDQPAVTQDFAEILAGGRKDRLLPNAADAIQRADPD